MAISRKPKKVTAETALSLSIAIVCYHSEQKELKRLLTSIKNSVISLVQKTTPAFVEVTLIDNSEPLVITQLQINEFKVILKDAPILLRLIQGHGNIGYGRGHNLVAKKAVSDFHLILNPDVILDVDSLVKGIEFLLANSSAVMISPKAFDSSGARQYLCKRFPSVMTLFVRGFLPPSLLRYFRCRLENYEMRDLDQTDSFSGKSREVKIISGCFMLCRTSALLQVGGFDPRYFLYFEDFDLSLRMSQIGEIMYLPTMKINHGGGHASKKGLRHIFIFIRSGVRFYNTHGWRWYK